jgi:hypothetical protein
VTFRKSHPPVGARPGTLAIPPGSPPPQIRLVSYDAQGVEVREVGDVETLAALPGDRITWLDVRGLGDEAVLRRIGDCSRPPLRSRRRQRAQRASSRCARTGDRGTRTMIGDGAIDALVFRLGRVRSLPGAPFSSSPGARRTAQDRPVRTLGQLSPA